MFEEDSGGGGIPEWVVTFGDMMSLLLTFFIMLVSLSEIKSQEKYQALVESMQKRFGYDNSMASFVPGRNKPRNSHHPDVASAGRAKRLDTKKGGADVQAPVGDNDRVQIVRPGSRSAIGTSIFFADDTAELNEPNREALRRLGELLGGKPQKVEVRGHTSRRPVAANDRVKDHFDLAYARCRAAGEFLTSELKIDPHRIRISVAGANEPIHIGLDAEKLRQNSRVEVFLLDEVVNDLTGTPDEQQARIDPAGK